MRSSKAAMPCSTAAVSSREPRSTATRCQSVKVCAWSEATVSRTSGPASWAAITTVTAGEVPRVVGSAGVGPASSGRSSTTSARHAAAASIAAAR